MAKTILIIIPPEKYFRGVLSLLKREVKKENIIYVTINKPLSHLTNLFKRERINTDKIFFIDAISKHVGVKEEEPKNGLFLESPAQITELSIVINKATEHLPGKKTIFFDSLSTLLIYNDESSIGKFSNFIINKMRSKDISTIMIALESDMDKKVIKLITSFVDEVKKWPLT